MRMYQVDAESRGVLIIAAPRSKQPQGVDGERSADISLQVVSISKGDDACD